MATQQILSSTAAIHRRSFLRGLAAAGSLAAVPALASCGGGNGGGSGEASSDVVTFGLNANAAIPTAGYDAVFAAFQEETGLEVRPNKLLYTEQVNNYLQSAPDDVLIWNAGYRMRFFADQGLVSDLSDVYETIGDNVGDTPYFGEGRIHPAGMARMLELQLAVGAVQAPIDVTGLIDTRFLPDDLRQPAP